MGFQELLEAVSGRNGWEVEKGETKVALPAGRSQTVLWQPFRHGDQEMIRVYSYIGPSESLAQPKLEAALRLNFSLPHGAMAIHGGQLVMTHTFLASDVDDAEVEATVRFLAEMSDRYEELIFGSDTH